MFDTSSTLPFPFLPPTLCLLLSQVSRPLNGTSVHIISRHTNKIRPLKKEKQKKNRLIEVFLNGGTREVPLKFKKNEINNSIFLFLYDARTQEA